MIQKLQLEAFKAFDRLDLELGALTLLSGLNSSGKSSILQAFALLRQSFDAGMLGDGVRNELLLNGPLIELGTGRDLYCEYSRRSTPELALTLHGAAQDIIGWRALLDNLDADVLPAKQSRGVRGEAYRTLSQGRFNYLRADRVSPALVYPRSHREVIRNRSLGSRGEYTIHYLTQFRDEVVVNERAREKSVGPTLGSQVAHWLGAISPDVRIEPDAVGGTDFVRVRFGFGAGSGLTGSASYRPTHVGFGLTYTLPIIVALLTTPPGDMLLMENPEAHVHPRGQAALGVLMTRAAAGGVQILLETHSDHLLNGIRLATKGGVVERDDVRLHFFTRQRTGEIDVESPVVEAHGRLSRWPSGFFDQWDHDLDQLLS